ncbi:MAG: hypothetical protein IT381_30140 [Deltaproteobacteria bacterium]|nr:hypothetical protein [Deltaproteobacteria bacterium]
MAFFENIGCSNADVAECKGRWRGTVQMADHLCRPLDAAEESACYRRANEIIDRLALECMRMER